MKQYELAVALIIEDCEPQVIAKTVWVANKEEAMALTDAQALRLASVLEGKPFNYRIEVAEPEEIVIEAVAA